MGAFLSPEVALHHLMYLLSVKSRGKKKNLKKKQQFLSAIVNLTFLFQNSQNSR